MICPGMKRAPMDAGTSTGAFDDKQAYHENTGILSQERLFDKGVGSNGAEYCIGILRRDPRRCAV